MALSVESFGEVRPAPELQEAEASSSALAATSEEYKHGIALAHASSRFAAVVYLAATTMHLE